MTINQPTAPSATALSVKGMENLTHILRGDIQRTLNALDIWMYALEDANVSNAVIAPGIRHIQATLAILSGRVDDLANATLLAHNQLISRPKRVHLLDRARQMVDEISQAYGIPTGALTITADPNLPSAWCDPNHCDRILYILIEKMWKVAYAAKGEAAHIHIALRYAGGMVVCAIRDTDASIALDCHEWQIDTHNTDIATNAIPEAVIGPGLDLCAGLLAQSDGSLSISTAEGLGKTIVLTLPSA